MAPKFYYFNIKARGESSRMAMQFGGMEFEDVRLTKEEFNAKKESFPFKQVPVLEFEDGTQIAQSYAILHYIGVQTGTFPTDPKQAMYVNQAVYTVEDIFKSMFNLSRFDQEDREQKYKELKEVKMPTMIKNLNEMCTKFGTKGYSVGDKMTIADFQVFVMCELMKDYKFVDSISNEDPTMAGNEAVMDVYENVKSQPCFQAHFEKYYK